MRLLLPSEQTFKRPDRYVSDVPKATARLYQLPKRQLVPSEQQIAELRLRRVRGPNAYRTRRTNLFGASVTSGHCDDAELATIFARRGMTFGHRFALCIFQARRYCPANTGRSSLGVFGNSCALLAESSKHVATFSRRLAARWLCSAVLQGNCSCFVSGWLAQGNARCETQLGNVELTANRERSFSGCGRRPNQDAGPEQGNANHCNSKH